MKNWIIRQQNPQQVKELSESAGITPFAAKLLLNRGITSRDEADEFFNGEEISSPFEITDMDAAAEVIKEAIESGERITVYGDYDCDGVTATVILYGYLEAIGAEADWYIPSRDEGYGLNTAAVEKLAKSGTKLIVTVDNGISAVKEADFVYENGMRLVITDHHQVPEVLPRAEAIVNPHRADDCSSCKELAGCGVALKLVAAIEEDMDSVLENWADLAAIGTIGDIVPLSGENRILVKRGLESLAVTENGGLKALLMQCGIDEDVEVTSSLAAFTLCPRINAAGRFSHAKEAAELFLCDNPSLHRKMAENLTQLNHMRQEEEKKILSEIDEMTDKNPLILKQRVLILSGKGWSHGVIGIVASKLLSRYGKPVLIITEEGELSRGSARSVEGFSLFRMLTELSDYTVKFGGHTKAAGFTVETARTEEFKNAVYGYAKRNYTQMPLDSLKAEAVLSGAELTIENIESLDYFQPFGEGNPEPLFCLKNAVIKSTRSLKDGKYTAFNAEVDGREFKVLNFRCAYGDFPYGEGDSVDMLVNADINDYNGRRTVSLKLADIRKSGFSQERYFAAKSAYERLCLGEDVTEVPPGRIIPDRETQKTVYDIIKRSSSLSACADMAADRGINYCLFRVTLDAFESVGLVRISEARDRTEKLRVSGKTDLDGCSLLQGLRKRFGCLL